MRKIIFTFLILTISFSFACGDSEENSVETNQQEIEQQEQAGLILKRDSKALKRSEIKLSPVAGSETDKNTDDSTLETTNVKQSEIEVTKTLSDLNATQTDEGIVINLPENILFDFDKSEIKSEAEPTLKKISDLLGFYESQNVQINGHTDSKGSDSYNQELSEKRAASVKKYLNDKFEIKTERLKTKGFGETKPIADNEVNGKDNPDGREKNRRVEVIIENAKKPVQEN